MTSLIDRLNQQSTESTAILHVTNETTDIFPYPCFFNWHYTPTQDRI